MRARRSWAGMLAVVLVVAACGSDDDATPADPVCAAWSAMTEARPGLDFPDDAARSAAYSEFADQIAESLPAFGSDAAATLADYEAAMRAYAADPSDDEALAGLDAMIEPMARLAAGIAGVCGVNVAEGR